MIALSSLDQRASGDVLPQFSARRRALMGGATGRCWLDDGNPEATATLNKHYAARTVTPHIMAQAQGALAPWMTSPTFGGPDLKTPLPGQFDGNNNSLSSLAGGWASADSVARTRTCCAHIFLEDSRHRES